MTSANGGTYFYAGNQYPTDGWVNNLEHTLLITTICFLIQGYNPKKTIK